MFAALLPPKIESLLHEDFLRLGAVPTLSHTEKFEQSLREVRQRGVARAVGDPIPGINGLSAPVFDSNGNVVLVITAIGAAGVFARWNSPLVADIKRCADAVSAELGWQNVDARATRPGARAAHDRRGPCGMSESAASSTPGRPRPQRVSTRSSDSVKRLASWKPTTRASGSSLPPGSKNMMPGGRTGGSA